MDIKKLLATVQSGVEFVEGLSPLIGLIPGVGQATAIVDLGIKAAGAVAEIVANIQDRVAEGSIVMNSDDQDELRGYAERLSAVNDQLAAYIDQS